MIEIEKLPEELREIVREDIQKYGEWHVSHMLYSAPLGRILKDLDESHTDFCWYYAAHHLIDYYASQDPTPMHYVITKETLNCVDISENDKKALDKLTRELVTYCCTFRKRLIKEGVINENPPIKDELGWYIPKPNENPLVRYEIEDINSLDKFFIDFLSEIGSEGKKQASDLLKNSQERYGAYKKSSYSNEDRPFAWSLWISEKRSVLSQYLSILSHVLWQDICKKIWDRENKNVPAITKAVLITTIKPPLSKNCKLEVSNETKITCYSEEGKAIAIVPCVDPKLVNLICKGLGAFSSLTGHKLFRWQVRTGFENWANQVDDARLISTTGGYEGIANIIGCGNSKQYPTDVKAILYAQAHGQFQYPHGGSGNMIILREMDKLRNGEPTKINIILGEMLLPNFTHLLPHGEKRRLVPITELPPLIGSKNTHAAQAMLQLLILEEFSNQSDTLFQRSSIQITMDKWEKLAKEAKLPKTFLTRVISGWIEGDLLAKPFLDKQGDEYTLGAAYGNVINFLECQGEQRIVGAKGGERSAANKKKIIGRQNSRKKKKDVNPP